MSQLISKFESLVETVRELRGEHGCPWDQKQTTHSLKKYLHEECDEIIQAIEKQDRENLCEELGDFLYLIIMLSEINRQNGAFSLVDVISAIDEKLVRRHPHVFGDVCISDDETLRKQWQRIKEAEKAKKKQIDSPDSF